MARSLQMLPTATMLLPIDEQGDLFEHVTDLTPLTELVLALPIRKIIDRVLAQHYNASRLKDHGLQPANRLLFRGPPGTGKTACAGAIALALGIPLVSVRQDGVVQQYMGRTSAALRKVFDFAKNNRAVVLFDEVDSIARARSKDEGGTTTEGEMGRVVTSLLVMLEEQRKHSQSVTIFATNHDGVLDHALWRRFDEIVEFTMPEQASATALMTRILKRHGYEFHLADERCASPAWRASARAITRGLRGRSFAEVERIALDAVKSATIDDRVTIQGALLEALERQPERSQRTRRSR